MTAENAKRRLVPTNPQEIERAWIEFVTKIGPVFPTRNKKPLVKKGQDWLDVASRDPAKIRQWLDVHGKNCQFAMPTGSITGFVVVDVDVKDGKQGMEFLAEKLKDLPDTVTIETPSGGQHKWFRLPPGVTLRNGADIFGKHSGIDIRAEGGYVVVPFSPGYTFVGKKRPPKSIEVAPEFLIEMLTPQDHSKAKAERGEVSFEKVKETLYRLDPDHDEFVTRDGWQSVMRAVHSATEGSDEGKQLFTEWSLSGQELYSKDPEKEIDRDWASYDAGGTTTFGTLVHLVQKYGKRFEAKPVEDTLQFTAHQKKEGQFVVNQHGKIKNSQYNMTEVFNCQTIPNGNDSFDNILCDLFHFDELSCTPCWTRSQPEVDPTSAVNKPIDDNALTKVRNFMLYNYEVDISKENAKDGLAAYASNHTFHPVQDHLNTLVWDGTPRIDTWLHEFMGTPNDLYHKAVGSKFLIGAVARAMDPGCKMDTMLVLEGDQGCRKSTVAEILGYGHDKDKEWFAAPALDIKGLANGNKDAITNTFGSWVLEMPEMRAVTKAEEDQVKEFISTRVDTATLKFQAFPIRKRRSFVFVGTINPYGEGKYIKDWTGARRYWPVTVRKTKAYPIDTDRLKEVIDQLYAEAKVRYDAGEIHYLAPGSDEEEAADIEQGKRMIGNDMVADIERFFDYGDGRLADRFHTADVFRKIWPLEKKIRQSHRDTLEQYMKNKEGWKFSTSLAVDGKKSRGWRKVT